MDKSNLWHRLKNAEVQAMLFALLIVGVLTHILVNVNERQESDSQTASQDHSNEASRQASDATPNPRRDRPSTLRVISLETAKSLADACIVAFLLGMTYEWRIRKDSEEHLSALLDEKFESRDSGIAQLSQKLTTVESRIDAALSGTLEALPIHSEAEFFSRLEASISLAHNRVDLTYFDNLPPSAVRVAQVGPYFSRVSEVMKANRHVMFRPLLRANEAMWPRFEELMVSEAGQVNCSVACLIDFRPGSECSEAVTVQLVDDDIVFLVSLGTQNNASGPRDLFVRSAMFSAMWSRYFDRLWRESVVIVDRGVVKPLEWQRVKELTGGQTGKKSQPRRTARQSSQ